MLKTFMLLTVLLGLCNNCFGESDGKPCTQTPGVSGPCRAEFFRYTYEASKGCYMFYYGGCQGNDNNFASLEECEKTCGKGAGSH